MTSKTTYRILLAEDEENFGAVLKNYLELSGYEVSLANNGLAAEKLFHKATFDLCILDIMMPIKDGFSLAESIRKKDNTVPFIFLTAKTLKEDIIKGYELGADDFIHKPFDTQVLIYKIKAILNRKKIKTPSSEELTIGKFIFNPKMRYLLFGEERKKLSPKEVSLLKYLVAYKNDILPREIALKDIWQNDDYFTKRSMDVYIAKLRKYLKADPSVEIVNIHSNGYMLKVEEIEH